MKIKTGNPYKVAVLYRVIQHWRIPIFERLNDCPELSIKLFHGCDFDGTKVINAKGPFKFPNCKMASIPIALRTSNGQALAPFSPGLFWNLVKYNPDIILCEGASNLPNNILAYCYAFLFRKKTIQWGLGEIKNRKKSFLRRIFDGIIELMERSSDACLAYSTRGKEYYKSVGVNENDIFVAVNVIDTDKAIENASHYDANHAYQEAHENTDFIVLFVGALTRAKNINLLINAFSEFSKQYSKSASLVIVGDGADKARLESIAKNTGCPNINFKGKVLDGVGKYFLSSDIFVLPGLGGLAISDSLGHGLPVIASIGDGCEKDLLSYGAGILDENLNETSLASHLIDIAENKKKLQTMKERASYTIAEKYNINTYMDNLRKCLLHSIEKPE